MTSTSKTIVFFGNERLLTGLPSTDAPLLRGLIEQGYHIAAVVSHHGHTQSRNERVLEVAEIAKEHNIPVFLPNKPMEIYDELAAMNADAAVLSAYGRIIPQEIIDLFPIGIINLHPSLLPKYRGPTPIESVILNGDTETGVSIMKLTAGMDDGPVYAQATLSLTGKEGKFGLYEKLSALGTQLLLDSLPAILSGELEPTPQSGDVTYCQLLSKKDGILDFNKSAEVLEREIRAFAGWPKSRTRLGSVDVILTAAHAVPSNNGDPGHYEIVDDGILTIDTAAGYLCVDMIQPVGKKEMPVRAFLAGYSNKL